MAQPKTHAEDRTSIKRTINSEFPFCSPVSKQDVVEVGIPAKAMDAEEDEKSEFEELAEEEGWEYEVVGTHRSQRGWNDRVRIW